MADLALAICYVGLGLTAALGILLVIEPAWLSRMICPPAEDIPSVTK